MVEKYLKISDFISYIFQNKYHFIPKKEDQKEIEGGDHEEQDEKDPFGDFILNFLMKTQDCIDYDSTMKFIIEQESHTILTDELFE